MVIPIGATIHMDGSCLGSVLKIAFLFGIFNLDLGDPMTMLTVVGIAILSGTVITGIPSGGVIGEILIISLYGFPLEALPIISMIGALIDPPATMINAVGDNVASMVVARMVNGKDGFRDKTIISPADSTAFLSGRTFLEISLYFSSVIIVISPVSLHWSAIRTARWARGESPSIISSSVFNPQAPLGAAT